MDILIPKRKLRLWLFGSMAVVVLAGVAVEVLKPIYELSRRRGVVPFLSLSEEANVPTFYSAAILLAAALLLALIAMGAKRNGQRFVAGWWILSAGFLYIAVDEAVQLHEWVTPLMSNLKEFSGVLTFSWVIPATALVAILGVLYIPFLRHLPPRTRNRFLLAGAIYVGGAVGMELPLGAWKENHGSDNLEYALIDAVEESLEMLGVNLFLLGLVDYLAQKGWAVRFATGEAKGPDPRPEP